MIYASEHELADERGEFSEGVPLPDPGENKGTPSPLHRLRDHRNYWRRVMAKMGCVCALTLSILTSGYQLEWDETKGPAAPIQLRNHQSALADAAFTSSAVQAGISTGVIRRCARSDLKCVLPLAVAVNMRSKNG